MDAGRGYAFFCGGSRRPHLSRRSVTKTDAPAVPNGTFGSGLSALYGVAGGLTRVAQFCGLFRLLWRKRHWYCATVAASGGSFPRSPLGAGWHLCCLALRFAGAQSGLAVCKRFEWMRFGERCAVCKRFICRPVASPSVGERAVRMRMNCAKHR